MSRDNMVVVRELYERFPDLAAGPPPPEVIALFDPEIRLDQTRNVVINSIRARGLGGGVEVVDRSATLHT